MALRHWVELPKDARNVGPLYACPAPALLTSTDEKVIADPQRWKQHCTGILGECAGSSLHWMCCPSVLSNALQEWKDLPSGGDRLDDQREWTPDAEARGQITTTNQRAVKSTDNGGTVDPPLVRSMQTRHGREAPLSFRSQ
jgi:hypothetical protein